ncbi:predicted protein [Botrytis cinerea T4]|uniref:Uncharacterized protein n=1 Tax=Botryotinia fuckeliana (strain T4) TaxID=999810 RepID=G2YAN0_BOTF4|nr:predicted protein [Botrytis cinerea T4]
MDPAVVETCTKKFKSARSHIPDSQQRRFEKVLRRDMNISRGVLGLMKEEDLTVDKRLFWHQRVILGE